MAISEGPASPDYQGKVENPGGDKPTRTIASWPSLFGAAAIALVAAGAILTWLELSAMAPKAPRPKARSGKVESGVVHKNSAPLLPDPEAAPEPPPKRNRDSPYDSMPGFTPLMKYFMSPRPGRPSPEVVREYLQREGVKIEKLASCSRPWKTFKFDGSKVKSLSFSPDGSKLAATIQANPNRLVVWDVAEGKRLLTVDSRRSESFFQVEFSPDGKFLFAYKPLLDGSTIGADGFTAWTPIIVLWNVETWKMANTLRGFGPAFAFSGDRKSLIAGDKNMDLVRLDLASLKPAASFNGDVSGISAISYPPDGRLLAYACGDGTVKIIDPRSGKFKRVIRGYFSKSYWLSLSLSPDGKFLAFSGNDPETLNKNKGVLLYDLAADKVVDFLQTWSWPCCCRFSPDGKTVVASAFGGIYLFDVATRKPRMLLQGHDDNPAVIAFSGDGKKLASGGRNHDGKICIWELAP